jgi:hypothetical protein
MLNTKERSVFFRNPIWKCIAKTPDLKINRIIQKKFTSPVFPKLVRLEKQGVLFSKCHWIPDQWWSFSDAGYFSWWNESNLKKLDISGKSWIIWTNVHRFRKFWLWKCRWLTDMLLVRTGKIFTCRSQVAIKTLFFPFATYQSVAFCFFHENIYLQFITR